MLKGKKILTADFFGTVLNDADKERVLVVKIVRERIAGLRCPIGYFPTRYKWYACDREVVIPWHLMSGVPQVVDRMPDWLSMRALRRAARGGGYNFTTTVKGRTYIDW